MKPLMLGAALTVALAAGAANADPQSSVMVQIEPAQARFEGASWSIDDSRPVPGPAPLPSPQEPMSAKGPYRSGHRLLAAPNGTHIVVPAAGAPDGCRAPADAAVDVRPGRAHLVVLIFTCPTAAAPAIRAAAAKSARLAGGATLKVTITPASAVAQGAAWALDDETDWRASATQATGLTDGDHVVRFRPPTAGPCLAPAPVVREVYNGQSIGLTVAYGGPGCR